MDQPIKFTSDQPYKDRLASHGFSFDDPDRRHPTRNDFPFRVLALSTLSGRDKMAHLMRDRSGRDNPDRSRLLPWLVPVIGWAGWPERAMAFDHHPPFMPPFELLPTETVHSLDRVLDWLQQLDPVSPGWTLALLGSLLMTQTVAMFQRRALLKASVAQVPVTQPDFFPETLPKTSTTANRYSWAVDAATRQGQVRDENQDALEVLRFNEDFAVLIVCDGAGGVGGGREAAQSAVAAISGELQAIWKETGALTPADLETAITAARKAANNSALEGVTTALLVLFVGEVIHFATLGDGAIAVIWPDGMVGPVQVPHHTLGRPSNEIGAYIGGNCDIPARTGTLRLEPGCFVFAMTDGVSDLFTFEDFACARHKYHVSDGLADSVIAHLEAARDPDTGAWLHSDNMTLAIAELVDGGGNDAAH